MYRSSVKNQVTLLGGNAFCPPQGQGNNWDIYFNWKPFRCPPFFMPFFFSKHATASISWRKKKKKFACWEDNSSYDEEEEEEVGGGEDNGAPVGVFRYSLDSEDYSC